MTTVLSILLIIAALFMIVTVLLQSSEQRGLGAIAGQATANMSKSKADAVDRKLALGTKIASAVFIVLAIALWIIG